MLLMGQGSVICWLNWSTIVATAAAAPAAVHFSGAVVPRRLAGHSLLLTRLLHPLASRPWCSMRPKLLYEYFKQLFAQVGGGSSSCLGFGQTARCTLSCVPCCFAFATRLHLIPPLALKMLLPLLLLPQVTNPAIDPIREKFVTSARCMVGPQEDITGEGAYWCTGLQLPVFSLQ